ncbi:hypothetical protein SDRG_10064 [Saprolegnia diclina VS20]|uniref:RING-type domain-containing protein n=1 Tax=Saprolegnia diclina (strain VS20) TaxID=1156394 RepID=T0RQH0_SAPDV|nr:hypothetical protein SDRG_10064 [Saprolegnia diclina VS20]EQC32317.1 hypothetical protein SDRG_10064 [Saprolegnia diclina VS20]|eukprot:XP_008614258.1 hypothetical protein SDRG_10064 [Saprolegnia diclina VS20]
MASTESARQSGTAAAMLCLGVHAIVFWLLRVMALTSHILAAAFAVVSLPLCLKLTYDVVAMCMDDEPPSSARGERQQLLLSRAHLQLLLTDRDFDSNDYEQLLQLDDHNVAKSHGASEGDIDRLPVVTVTETMLQSHKEATGYETIQCSICLEDLAVGAQARMVPCFHRFHPQCIDPWLVEKAECPICKFPAIG